MQPDRGSFYVPNLTGSAIALQVKLAVIEDLGFATIEALKSVPKRGLEIGGILLGRLDVARSTILIEDYEPVKSEHLYGPSWLLSAADQSTFSLALARLREQASNDLRPVGFYRSQTRDGFDFDDQDNAIRREMFDSEPSVCLLIKPSISGPGMARIGMRIEDLLLPLSTFPFSVRALSEGDFQIVETPSPARDAAEQIEIPNPTMEFTEFFPPLPPHGAEQIGIAETTPGERETPPGVESSTGREPEVKSGGFPPARLRRPQVVAALLLTAAAALFGVFLASRPRSPSAGIRTQRPTVPAQATARAVQPIAPSVQPAAKELPDQDDGVILNIQRQNGGAILSWNREAPVIQRADSALLTIEDGRNRRELRLTRAELDTGQIVYIPKGRDLSFQMQLFGPDRAAIETIYSPSGLSEIPASGSESPSRMRKLSRGGVRKTATQRRLYSSAKNANPIPEQIAQEPSSANVPPSAPAANEAAPPPESRPQFLGTVPVSKPAVTPEKTADSGLVTSASAELIGRAGFRGVLDDLSPKRLLRFRSGDDKLTPPRVLRQTLPELSPPLVSEIHGEKQISVKITVSSGGEVVKAELVDGRSIASLGPAILYAARQWVFEPARTSGRPVESKVLLRFVLKRP